MDLDIFENDGTSEKECVQIEDWGFSALFGLGFQENSIYTVHLCLVAKILQTGAKSTYTKAGFKIYRNLDNFIQAVESPKSWHLMGFSPKNYIPSPKRSYTVDLSNITFNYLCVDSPNYLCHFWNHKSFLTTQLICIFLAQT